MTQLPERRSVGFFSVWVFAICLTPLSAFSTPILLEWSDTVQPVGFSLPPGVNSGDPFTFSIIVDNGGTGTISQTWTGADFVSASIDVNSGVYTGIFTGTGPGYFASGNFATDAVGNVISVGVWVQGFPGHLLTDNVAGSPNGVWFINGTPGIWADNPTTYALDATNVGNNPNPAFWSARSAVPEPTTLLLMGLGLAGLGFARQRRLNA